MKAYNLSGKYPAMANYLVVSEDKNGIYCVENFLTQEVFEMDAVVYQFLKCLDGNTNPWKLARKLGVDGKEIMDLLEVNLLIRTNGKKLVSSIMTKLITCYVPARKNTDSFVPKVLNAVLMFTWFPVLFYGIGRFVFKDFHMQDNYMFIGYVASLIIGLILHEISHAMACLAYGGHFFEAGIMASLICPGAYVLIDYSKVKSRRKRIQIIAAGVEMNLLLTGVFLVLSSCCVALSGFFFMAAFNNLFLAVLNLTCVNGLDGCTILFELLGIDGGMDKVKHILNTVFMKDEGKRHNAAIVATCVALLLSQILLPLLLINNVLIVLGGLIL